ncbi:MAG: 30S ribosomal protein S15 [Firmicutes bacterium]|uniref:Small ribosomal subunit protein uS15 n=1 Tax=Candidatus Onthovivens merdipullorum TaxID=2840889 RepID=A0A9D9DI45_9BACL|nr:30S ribosomal protein S15 [Candidatus Onthovivens merdipullorum]
MALLKEEKAAIVKKFAQGKNDTGSTEVQVALLTSKIKALTEHLKANDKDNSARRALLVLVGKRKSLLAYLERKDRDAYAKLIAELGLRK